MRFTPVSAFFLICSVTTVVLSAEPSVYGVDTQSSSHKAQKFMQKHISNLQQRIIEQEERIDGLKSIIEGLSASVHALESGGNVGTTNNNSQASYMRLEAMIEEVKQDYVRKVPLKADEKPGLIKVADSNGNVAKPVLVKKTAIVKSDKELFSEGVRLYLKKRYSEAKERFSITDNKGYKAATSNYYLGEIAYYTKQYKDAIFFFKKSAGLNDKTTYIDTLLLHTAVSLENSGEKVQAKAFYENIIVNYKGKRSAVIASERLKKL